MKITYLIGNGFDLHFGLKTRYSDFYNYYINRNSGNRKVAALKRKCLKEKYFWSDLEIALGQATSIARNVDDYVEFIKDIQISLAAYCKEQQESACEISKEKKSKVCEELVSFDKYFSDEKIGMEIARMLVKDVEYTLNFIVFNYTETLEAILPQNGVITQWFDNKPLSQCYSAHMGELIHIHGTTQRHMILGVNDTGQIANTEFAQNEKFQSEIIKPLMNKNAMTHREERASDCINRSDIICIYGMSMGDTDKLWWNTIGNHLVGQPDSKLIIFDIPRREHYTRDFLLPQYKEKKDLFLSKTSLSDTDKQNIADRIYVCLSEDLF